MKTPAKKKVKTNTKDVTASPAFFTACEKMRHNEPKSKSTKAKKRINFDQQVGTQNQSLSERYGNPPEPPTYAEGKCGEVEKCNL